ncbi:glycosyltransferase family 4 protein [Ferruginibacter albus]|uniref:glycosyltransferase family 4 protein n=1 Tax=Ferruginibacter albus TaxID=2875540 RepID=UPI001CC7A4BF|nr:glycosyltransferase family 4 protein [Ferruginibacter albus]UAY50675.1 glycosyltransferase family 4 protein [Ferruginibacter albus]
MKKLAIVTTHPIQYYAPWFRLLSEKGNVLPKVFYTWHQSQQSEKFDPGFGKKISWDIPLLEGYDYTFVTNTSSDPGSHHFKGIINPSLIREIKDWEPHVILVIGWSFQSHLKCIKYFHKKIPVLFRGDSTLLDELGGIKKILRRVFLKWVYRHIDYALYVGNNNKQYFLAHGLKEDQLFFAPHAIDNDRFAQPDEFYTKEAEAWREQLGIKEDDIVLLFVGKLEPKKNPHLLLQLAKQVTSERLKFVLVGNGVLEKELKSLTENDKRIIFIDFQNQQKMPVTYRLGNILILPSVGPGETWGLAVNEAMASGLPAIISSKVGCGSDLVKNGYNGLLFDVNAPDTIASFLNKIIADKASLSAMGNASKEIIRNFSFNEIVTTIEQLINSF